jgi:transducin (beta)-like 1
MCGCIIIMSIVLRANELNILIYKYLLEAGLTHTAYSLFNEALLAQPLQEFRFDLRPGHLLALLEKALIYAQIESHVNLVSRHTCRANTWNAGSRSAC